jgi:hypothetical protein
MKYFIIVLIAQELILQRGNLGFEECRGERRDILHIYARQEVDQVVVLCTGESYE